MNISTGCPAPPFPGLIKGGSGQQFALAVTILFPLYIAFATSMFFRLRKTTLFLRKRSFKLLLLCAFNTLIPWSCTALYDYIGSENFPCGLFVFLVYISNPSVSYPPVLKIAQYYNQYALFKLARELQNTRESNVEDETVLGVDPLKGEISLRSVKAHLRVAFCFSRVKQDQILNAKFARTYAFAVLWFLLTAAPFAVVYFIRLAMNPQWLYCTGCELEVFDAAYLIAIATFALILCALSNPSFSRWGARRDALRIVRECMWSWLIGGFFYNLSFILYLIDPGQVYAQGLFNWRLVKLFATAVLFHIQSIHQIYVSKRLKRSLILAPMLDQNEKFDEVMSNKELRSKLTTFLDGELSGEILQFLTAVDDYKNNFDKDGAQFKGRQIFSTFLIRGAPYEVNISSHLRTRLIHRMPSGNFEQNIFDAAYLEVKKNLLDDGFARFIKKLEKQAKHQSSVKSKAVVSSS
jgi:hypothetical protein